MRADRLVAVLLLLQARGRVTAAEVGAELEVSERTARRDLDALAVAGVPLYSRQGRNGGWELVGGARTDLSGLNADEMRALFLVAGPAATTPAMRQALRKLVRAMPETMRRDAERASDAVVVDPNSWWGPDRKPTAAARPPLLDAVERSVIDGMQVRLGYVDRKGNDTSRVVHPLGLVSKGPTWYLIADTLAGLRTFRVNRVSAIDSTDEPAVRPPGFDLQTAWDDISERVRDVIAPVRAVGEADVKVLAILRGMLGDRLRLGPRSPTTGRQYIEVAGQSASSIAGQLAGLGDAIELIGPPEVRARLAEIGKELSSAYGR
jgi:predicted DNA-binding transcriptional regulator YafY